MKKILCGMLIWLAGMAQAELTLLSDTFDVTNSHDINTNLVSRQSGTEATVTWLDNAGNNWTTQIDSNVLRLYKNAAGGGTVSALLEKDFAPIAGNVRISVDIMHNNSTNGFSMVNFGMAAADGANANAGYSFRLDSRTGTSLLKFYDNGTLKGTMDVDSLADGGFESLVVEFAGSASVSATFNGQAYDFGSGQTNYTGTGEAENYIMLAWFGDGSPALTSASFDNVSVVATQVDAFPAFAEMTGPNLILNGDFSALTNQSPSGADQWNMTGTFGDYSGTTNCTADLVSWASYYDDPNSLIPAVGTVHVNDGSGELDGTFYLDTHLNGDTVVLNSSMDYRNGVKQEDILNGAVIDSGVTYLLTVGALKPSYITDASQATFTVALTTGIGSESTNTANAVSGSLQEVAVSGMPSEFGSVVAAQISGADLLAAQSSAQVNVIFDHVNGTEIPGFPGSVASNDVNSISLVSQVQVDSVSLAAVIEPQAGDLNKDGVVNQEDADLAQDYLDGNGGLSAADRQNALISDGLTAAEALEYLNLSGFDLDDDGDFDADDVAGMAAFFPTTLKMVMSGSAMDFEWTSKELKQYDLESCTSLTAADWTNYHDGVAAYENILASETGTNTLSGVLTDGATRFFRVVEEAGPTSFISVSAGSFEDPPAVSGSWSVAHSVWNPTISNLYQLNKGTANFTALPDGEWIGLMNNMGTISQDLATTVNAGDTLTVTFSAGNAKESSSTTGGGVFNAVFRVGTTAYTLPVDTTSQAQDTWQTYTHTVTISNTGNLSLEFTNVSGKPWLDNISSVTRTEPQ